MDQSDVRKVLSGFGLAALVAGLTAMGCAGVKSS